MELEVLLLVNMWENRWTSCIYFLLLSMCVHLVVCCWSIGCRLVRYVFLLTFDSIRLFINLCTYLDNGVSTFFKDLLRVRARARSFGMQQRIVVCVLLNRFELLFLQLCVHFKGNSLLCLHYSDFVTVIAIANKRRKKAHTSENSSKSKRISIICFSFLIFKPYTHTKFIYFVQYNQCVATGQVKIKKKQKKHSKMNLRVRYSWTYLSFIIMGFLYAWSLCILCWIW